MTDRDIEGILKDLRKNLVIDSAVISVVTVMVFGQAKVTVSFIFGNALRFDPVFIAYMLVPSVLFMTISSRYGIRQAREKLRSGQKSKSQHIVLTGIFSMLIFTSGFIIDFLSYPPGVNQGFILLTSSVFVALLTAISMGCVFHFRIRSTKKQVLRRIEGKGISNSAKALRNIRVIESIVIVIGAVMTFGLVEFGTNRIFGQNPDYMPIDMLGMIAPMGVIMWFISYYSLKTINRTLYRLVSGIEKVSSGEFAFRIDIEKSGPYRELFENFNRMSRELENIQTLRDDFINHFSHEFKTPITSINGLANILLNEDISREDRGQYLRIIASESERLSEMSNNALMMTKLDSQGYILNKTPYDLDEQLKQCAILLSPQWTHKNIDLTADLDPVRITGSEDLLRQVWINLLGNAVKFTQPGGIISIRLKKEENSAVVRISDNGRGLTGEERERAFEKYYQGTLSFESKGLGLGLAIAKNIVELSGGMIGVESAPGSGSAFTVRVPMEPVL